MWKSIDPAASGRLRFDLEDSADEGHELELEDKVEELRFFAPVHGPMTQWKLGGMDLESRRRWEDDTRLKENMFGRAHILEAPWCFVPADNKKKARLNCIHHSLSQVPYEEIENEPIVLSMSTMCGGRYQTSYVYRKCIKRRSLSSTLVVFVAII